MPINSDKPHLWKQDIAASVDQFNKWFMKFAPKAYRDTRVQTTKDVERTLGITNDFAALTADVLKKHPGILPTLRMSLCPPIARDRLVGLAYATKNLVYTMEEGTIPPRINPDELQTQLARIAGIVARMLDEDIFPWVAMNTDPTEQERHRAARIVADRLCVAVSNDVVRRARRTHQLSVVAVFLESIGYHEAASDGVNAFLTNEPGTFSIDVVGPLAMGRDAFLPVDVLVQPNSGGLDRLPVLMDVGSSQDDREAEAQARRALKKHRSLQTTYSESLPFVLMLSGQIDAGVLGTLAAESLDWVWQHKISQFAELLR